LIVQASKQSLCPVVPVFHENMYFGDFLEKEIPKYDMTLWGCMPKDLSSKPIPLPEFFSSVKKPPASVLLVIGPEGDFTEKEKIDLIEASCHPVSLSPNRLRTETAAVVFVASVMGHWNGILHSDIIRNFEKENTDTQTNQFTEKCIHEEL